jgi:hypothetical protein
VIYITYYKTDGEIATPCIVSSTEQTFDSVFGARAEEMKLIYESLTISLNDNNRENDFLNELMKNYKVDITTKQLIKKENNNALDISYIKS